MQLLYREREEKGGGLQLQDTPGCKKTTKKWGGGLAKCILHQDTITSVRAAGLPNAKDRTGSSTSSRLQFYPPAYYKIERRLILEHGEPICFYEINFKTCRTHLFLRDYFQNVRNTFISPLNSKSKKELRNPPNFN
jgi:hypothetical protein